MPTQRKTLSRATGDNPAQFELEGLAKSVAKLVIAGVGETGEATQETATGRMTLSMGGEQTLGGLFEVIQMGMFG